MSKNQEAQSDIPNTELSDDELLSVAGGTRVATAKVDLEYKPQITDGTSNTVQFAYDLTAQKAG